MPKADKTRKSTLARQAAHPHARGPLSSSSSKKKTKSSAKGVASHSASLEAEMHALANPGKLKPIRATSAKKKTRAPSAAAEDAQLENELHTAGSFRASKGGDAMDDDEADAAAAAGSDSEDDAAMARDDTQHLSARMSKKILEQVHRQQKEEMEGEGEEEERQGGARSSAGRLKSLSALVDGEDDLSDADELGEDEEEAEFDDDVEDVELSPEDAASLELFMPQGASSKGRTLADMIMDKIREKEAAASAPPGFAHMGGSGGADEAVRSKLDPKIVEVYTKVGKFLSHYSSGKIPKAFKLIPNLKSWEEVLYLTHPESWSVQSYYVATKIFSSNFNPKQAQRFYALILLPKIREDIESHKHLNFHLYQSIKRSLYKPAAFFKGLLLPLAEEGASAREAVIFSSILAKCTIPVLHSSVALLKLAQMPYSGTTALFIKTLLNKKYSLPRQVLRALVQYFCAFKNQSAAAASSGGGSSGHMPLIWHQTLLTFVQRYKFELTANQITAIKNLLRAQPHAGVSAEIRRELAAVAAQVAGGQPAGVAGAVGAAGSSRAAGSFSAGSSGFQSLAAAIKNPQLFSIPTPDASMEM